MAYFEPFPSLNDAKVCSKNDTSFSFPPFQLQAPVVFSRSGTPFQTSTNLLDHSDSVVVVRTQERASGAGPASSFVEFRGSSSKAIAEGVASQETHPRPTWFRYGGPNVLARLVLKVDDLTHPPIERVNIDSKSNWSDEGCLSIDSR